MLMKATGKHISTATPVADLCKALYPTPFDTTQADKMLQHTLHRLLLQNQLKTCQNQRNLVCLLSLHELLRCTAGPGRLTRKTSQCTPDASCARGSLPAAGQAATKALSTLLNKLQQDETSNQPDGTSCVTTRNIEVAGLYGMRVRKKPPGIR